MSRAVPNQDSSPESFARLLSRLTKSPGAYSPALDPDANPFPDSLSDSFAAASDADDAVRVSISNDGAAALNGSRKRTMAPVRLSRNSSEASEISYEQALRLHSRSRVAELSELPPLPVPETPLQPPKVKPNVPSRLSRSQAEAKALSALRQAKNRSAVCPENLTTPKAETASGRRTPMPAPPSETAHVRSRQAAPSKNKKPKPATAAFGQASHSDASSRPSHPQKSRKGQQSSTAGNSHPINPPAISPHTARKARAGNLQRKQSRASAQDQPAILPIPPSPTPNTLELEVASPHLALAQRQSIVSIRLSSIESEQLRQRAAESGISVSAYMRSCVLEAEHLRSQVKQALAELRTLHPHPIQSRPAQPQLESPPLFASVYTAPNPSSRDIRPGLFGFLSGIAAIVLGRFQR